MEEKKRVAVFIDASNLHHAQIANGWRVDYKKLTSYLDTFGESVGRYYFTPSPLFRDTKAVDGFRKFKKALIFMGYTVKDKEVKEIRTKDPQTKQIITKLKGDLDTDISNWIDGVYRDFQIAVIMGGDSDLLPAIERLVTDGKYVIAIGNRNNTAIEIQNIAHHFIDLKDLEKEIKLAPK